MGFNIISHLDFMSVFPSLSTATIFRFSLAVILIPGLMRTPLRSSAAFSFSPKLEKVTKQSLEGLLLLLLLLFSSGVKLTMLGSAAYGAFY